MPIAPPVTAYTPAELWYFNGVALQSANGAWNISTMGGSRFGIPVLRGQNVSVPYRAGQSWRAKWPDARTVTLTMWADGQGTTSSYPAADQRLAFNNNIQQLRSLFWSRGGGGSTQGTLQRNWYITQGTPTLVQSSAMAEIAGSMDLTMSGRTHAAFSVDLLLSDPYFYGVTKTSTITTTGTITGLGEGIVGEGWSSPVNAFTLRLSTAMTVTNTTMGVSVTVASGPSFPVTIDVLNQTATDNLGANAISSLSHAGSRMWMCLQNGSNAITTSTGNCVFTWNDTYI